MGVNFTPSGKFAISPASREWVTAPLQAGPETWSGEAQRWLPASDARAERAPNDPRRPPPGRGGSPDEIAREEGDRRVAVTANGRARAMIEPG